jgi:hypothetical protein
MSQNERTVLASVVSTGLNGGELLLTDWGHAVDSNGNQLKAFDQLKAQQWIMLCGPHPNSSTSDPKLVLNWYQVISIEQPPKGMAGYSNTYQQRVVTLRGPEWPWQPSAAPGNISNNLCVGICRGAVAVHSKTMRLEGRNSSWSIAAGEAGNGSGAGGGAAGGGDGGFGGGGGPGGGSPTYIPF